MKPIVMKESSSSLESPRHPWCELLKEFIKISAFDGSGLLLVKNKEFSDCIKMMIICWEVMMLALLHL